MSLLSGQAEPFPGLVIILLYAVPFFIHEPKPVLPVGIALFRRQAVIFRGFLIALLNAIPLIIQLAQVVLPAGVPLAGGKAVPAGRLLIIPLHAIALVVHHAQVVLPGGVPLSGGQAVPLQRLVIRPFLPALVAQPVLRAGAPRLGHDLGGHAAPHQRPHGQQHYQHNGGHRRRVEPEPAFPILPRFRRRNGLRPGLEQLVEFLQRLLRQGGEKPERLLSQLAAVGTQAVLVQHSAAVRTPHPGTPPFRINAMGSHLTQDWGPPR